MNEKENINQEMGSLSDLLNEHMHEDLLQVPEGYFEQLENEILQKTIYALPKKGRLIRMNAFKYAAAVAAVLMVVFFGIKWLGNNSRPTLEVQLANMSDQEIDQYIDEQLALLSYEDLHSYIAENISDIETEMLFTTNFIDDATAEEKITGDVHEQVIQSSEIKSVKVSDGSLLDEELLKQLDDQTLQDYLNDETIFDDFAL